MPAYLPINEYSNKYGISISTIRRRIRGKELEFKMENGKYFILDRAPEVESRGRRFSTEVTTPVGEMQTAHSTKNRTLSERYGNEGTPARAEEPNFSTTHRLLDELKKAYAQILQEKEEQIISLKEEISDLRTLVRVLENENARLRPNRF